MRLYLCILFILLYANASSQTIIKGRVEDQNGQPLDFFTAVLLSAPDSLLIDGAACKNGVVELATSKIGNTLLKINSLGYEDKIIPLTLQNIPVNIGTVVLQQRTTSIDQVVVTAHRPTIISKADRTVVTVDGSILSNASDGTDMLRKTPGLTVDKNENIVIFGKGTPIVYIDNKEVRSSQEIKMLNPQNIQSIEIIDNPSAAYNAQGTAIVLIHTIKRTDHYFVRLGGSLSQGRQLSENVFTEGHLSKGKLSTDLYYSYSNDNSEDGQLGFYTPDDIYTIYSKDKGPSRGQAHQYYFDMTYNPSPKHTIGLQSNGYRSNYIRDVTQYTWSDNPESQAFNTYSHLDELSWQLGGTLYYDWSIDTLGQSLRIVGDVTEINNKSTRPYYNVLEPAAATVPFINTNDNNRKNILYSLNADYIKPLGRILKIETGAKLYYIGSNYHIVQKGSTSLVQEHASKEWNLAGYISLTTKLSDKISMQYGLRVEYNNRKGWDNTAQYVNFTALDWFPNFLFNYRLSDNFNFGLSYTKRLSRPSLDELNPSLVVADSLMTRKGNPDLKSKNSHIFQLTFGFLKDFSIRASFNYNTNPTYFTIMRDEETPQLLNIRYINRDKSKSYSISAGYNRDIGKWWATSIYLGFAGTEYKYIENGVDKNNNIPYWNLNTTNTFYLPWKIAWDIGFYWNSAGSWEAIYQSSSWNLYSTIRRDFFNGALSCRISVNDLFHTSMGQYQQTILPGRHWNQFDADSRYVRLSITYKLGKSKYQYKSKSASREEQKRL